MFERENTMKLLLALLLCISMSACTGNKKSALNVPFKVADEQNLWLAVKDRNELRVGVKTDAPPFARQETDGSFWGFDIDIAKALARELGVKIRFVPVVPSQRIPYIREGRVDIVIASMTITREREKDIDFSIPYFQDGQGLLFRCDSHFENYRDLKNKKVGAVLGSTSMKNLKKIQPDCSIISFENYQDGVQALVDNKVDAFTSDYLILMGLKHKHKDKALIELRGERFTAEPYGMAMRENQSDFRDEVNNAIMTLWENGLWQEIYETWFGEGSVYRSNLKFHVEVSP